MKNFLQYYFNYNKNRVYIIYPENRHIDVSIIDKESEDNITIDKKIIVKNTDNAFIDKYGNKHYFVNSDDITTSLPFPIEENEEEPISRETIFNVCQNNLLRSLNETSAKAVFISIFILLAGTGIGYMIGEKYGSPDDYSITNHEHNYPESNETDQQPIIISSFRFIYDVHNINVRGWLNG